MFHIISVASSIGATEINSGMEKGPGELVNHVLSRYHQNIDRKFTTVAIPRPNYDHNSKEYSSARFLPEINAICRDIMRKVSITIEKKKKPLVLMGDDSSTIGVIYGILKKRDDIGIIWFDAHGDINTPDTSPSGCFYGMGLAHILGYGHPEILKNNRTKKFIRTSNVVMIGQRLLDSNEKEIIEKENIILISELEEKFEEKINHIIKRFRDNGIKHIFLHYDMDVIDASHNPPVFVPSTGGLPIFYLFQITEQLRDCFNIIGASISNYIPEKDNNNRYKSIIDVLIRKILNE